MLENPDLTNIDRLNIYHAIKENQAKIINDLKFKLIKMNEGEDLQQASRSDDITAHH